MVLKGLSAGLIFLKNPAVFSIDLKAVQLCTLTALRILEFFFNSLHFHEYIPLALHDQPTKALV